MVDEGTLTVGYREWRGEPRGKKHDEQQGDCIDCMACVNVCPMGIDIREGQQMACITCALCIDACDDVMAKIGKPRGLVDYLALNDAPPQDLIDRVAVAPMDVAATGVSDTVTVDGDAATAPNASPAPILTRDALKAWKPKPAWQHIFRRRTIVYTTLWALIGVGLLVALFVRPEIDMTVAQVRNPTFVTLSDGTIRNAYDIRLRNKHGEPRLFHVWLPSDSPLELRVEGGATRHSVTVPANETKRVRAYVDASTNDTAAGQERTPIRFWVADLVSEERAHVDSLFFGKESFDVRSNQGG
jgi:cytochrome c oxidase accessory protein FixG